jgi:rubrerythrin
MSHGITNPLNVYREPDARRFISATRRFIMHINQAAYRVSEEEIPHRCSICGYLMDRKDEECPSCST